MQFSNRAVNTVTNIFGTIAGVPEILEGVALIGANDYLGGIAKLCLGVGLLVGFYFVGKGTPTA